VERVNESDQYWEDMIKVSLATTIISFLYFGIVGVIVNTTQVMTVKPNHLFYSKKNVLFHA
jgi:hypothetical protein